MSNGNSVKISVKMKNFWEYKEEVCQAKLKELLGLLEGDSYKMLAQPQNVPGIGGIICLIGPAKEPENPPNEDDGSATEKE